MLAMTFPLLWFLFLVMVCDCATRIEQLLFTLMMLAMTFPHLWFLFPVMVCNSATRIEKLLYLDDIDNDLPPPVVPVPSHGLQLSHKDRETPVPL
jgi:hypothetical protein